MSNAGGLGMITALTQPSADALRQEIRRCKAMLKPGMQVGTCTFSHSRQMHTSHNNTAHSNLWSQALLSPTFAAAALSYSFTQSVPGVKVGVNLTLLPALAPPDYPAYMKAVVEEGIKIVETAGASPEEMIKALKAEGDICATALLKIGVCISTCCCNCFLYYLLCQLFMPSLRPHLRLHPHCDCSILRDRRSRGKGSV